MAASLAPGRPSATLLRLVPFDAVHAATPVDYHVHTTYTDGKATVEEMADAGAAANVRELLFSDHVRATSTYFDGFARHVRATRRANMTFYVGSECKVLDLDGGLDCSPAIAAECDAIIGSVHRPPSQGGGAPAEWRLLDPAAALRLEFDLAMAIVTRSAAHILGHPMGMCVRHLNLRPVEEIARLAVACRDHGKAFELSGRYCPDPAAWLDAVRAGGCDISFGSDAHLASQVGSSWNMFTVLGT